MIIFLYGSDTYRTSQKLKEIIAEYQKKHGSILGCEKFDLKEKNAFEKMKNFFESAAMFSSKKLAVIENALSSSANEELEQLIKKSGLLNSQDNFLIIVEGDASGLKEKSKKLFAVLKKKPVVSQEFKNFPSYSQAKPWLKKEAEKNHLNIEDSALEALFNAFGSDTWRLINELQKISLYQPEKKITKTDVLEISVFETHPNIFKIFDAFFEQNKKKMIFYFEEAVKSDLDAGMIFNLFIGQLRVAVLLALGQSKEIEAHPFVVQKIKSQLWRFKKEKLSKLYDELANIDLAVKTGKIDYESALEKIILDF
ncbi:MAG: DNA polymerase III subunit delta [bacterium]|nr:DNA polymerase III subunit delta [bacterium]